MTLNSQIKNGLGRRELEFADWYVMARQWSSSQNWSLSKIPSFPQLSDPGYELEFVSIQIPANRQGDKEAFKTFIIQILLQRQAELYGNSILVGKLSGTALCIAKRIADEIGYFYLVFTIDGNVLNIATSYDAARIRNPNTFENRVSNKAVVVEYANRVLFKTYRMRGIATTAAWMLLIMLRNALTTFLSMIQAFAEGFTRSGSRCFAPTLLFSAIENKMLQAILLIFLAIVCIFFCALLFNEIVWKSFEETYLNPRRNASLRFNHYMSKIPSAGFLEPCIGLEEELGAFLQRSKGHLAYVERFLSTLRQAKAMTEI